MAEITERPFRRERDLPGIFALIAQARASSDPHAFLHPGGLQWLLRRLPQPTFSVRQWYEGDALAGVVITDSAYVMVQSANGDVDRHVWLLREAEAHLHRHGEPVIETSVWDGDHELLTRVRALGFEPSGTYGHELVNDDLEAPAEPELPLGFTMGWLEPSLDDSYVELHRAAWSTWGPSTYDRAAHGAVTTMPDFERELVPLISASDGTLAAYCIGWFDPVTRMSEIEPLRTRPVFRRRGLARAVVEEVVRRSTQRGARSVLVWGAHQNTAALALYESCGFRSRRVMREYRRVP